LPLSGMKMQSPGGHHLRNPPAANMRSKRSFETFI
jgi:hypothetical protein